MIEPELLDSLRDAINLIREKEQGKDSHLKKVLEKLEEVKKKLEDKNKQDGESGDS